MSVYYNDIDSYCCKVLQKHIDNGNLPGGHVDERDIRTVHATDFMGYDHIHLFAGIGGFPLGMSWANYPTWLRTLTGGFPCQDISNSGKRVGITGERSGLWKEMYRLIQESTDCYGRFDFILIENVSALLGRGLDTVLIDLTQAGYDAQWTTLRASDFGAPHQRERVFIVAYPNDARPSSQWRSISTWETDTVSASGESELAYPQGIRSRSWWPERESTRETVSHSPSTLAYPQQTRMGCSETDMAYPTGKRLAWEQWQELQGRGVRSSNGNQTLAHTESEQDRGLCIRGLQPNTDASGVGQADANSQGLQIRDGSAIEGGTFPAVDGRSTRQFESLFCRNTPWLPDGLDRYQWPARPGEEQYPWEPERIVTEKVPHRVQRLKALGNSIVPHCIEYVSRCILASLEVEQVESEGVA